MQLSQFGQIKVTCFWIVFSLNYTLSRFFSFSYISRFCWDKNSKHKVLDNCGKVAWLLFFTRTPKRCGMHQCSVLNSFTIGIMLFSLGFLGTTNHVACWPWILILMSSNHSTSFHMSAVLFTQLVKNCKGQFFKQVDCIYYIYNFIIIIYYHGNEEVCFFVFIWFKNHIGCTVVYLSAQLNYSKRVLLISPAAYGLQVFSVSTRVHFGNSILAFTVQTHECLAK